MRRRGLLVIGSALVGLLIGIHFASERRGAVIFKKHAVRPPNEAQSAFESKAGADIRPKAIPSVPGLDLTIQDKEKLGKIVSVFSAPIVFYGKVVDDHGQPVGGAHVFYSAADQYFGGSTKYNGVSDLNGLFFLEGAKGAGLYVEVSKEGYDRIANRSYGSFGYGMPSGKPPPSQDNPALFVLRKKGEAGFLISVDRDVVIPKDGTPVEINLGTGKPVELGRGELRIECWANNANLDPNLNERYDWRFRISVPGGGMIQRTGEFSFEAPKDGYAESEEIEMPHTAERWSKNFTKEYFLKLSGNRYARMTFRITSDRNQFASITSFLNPSGSRNLEYDPTKRIEPSDAATNHWK
jgi:hypothetical protein